jgi:hypothetical protein
MLHPIGAIGAMLTGALDLIGGVFGRKKKPTRGQRFWPGVFYVLLLLGGVAIIALVIHELYFEK